MKKLLTILIFCLVCSVYAKSSPVVIKMALGGGDLDEVANKAVAKEFNKEHKDIQVKLFKNPSSTNDVAGLYAQTFQSKSDQYDIMQFDSSWLGGMADNLLDLNKYKIEEATKNIFPKMVHDNLIDGKLVAVPFYADAGLIFYRKDLLKKYNCKVPATWTELAVTANKIQGAERKAGNKDMEGFVWQGEAYEGLTCDALEWIHSNGGGRIISEDKKVTLNNPNAVKAIETASRWIGTISPEGVTAFKEDGSKSVFVGGNAVFLRSWPYIYGLSEENDSPIKGKVGIMPIPSKYPELRSGIAGFESLAINKYTKNPEDAVVVLKYFTSPKAQKIRAIVGKLCPSIPALYDDKEVKKANPSFAQFLTIFNNTFSAPKAEAGTKYNKVSTVFYKAVYSVLLKETSAALAMKKAADEISNITGFPEGKLQSVVVK